MSDMPNDPIGAAWLAKHYSLVLPSRLPVVSQVGSRRTTSITDGYRQETFVEAMRPASEPAAHLQFYLRHEIPDLAFLSYLFSRMDKAVIQQWINHEPTGQYARRAAFLYEWLTDDSLEVPERLNGNYVDAINDAEVVAATSEKSVKVARWRVNDNLPGTRYFCPLIVKTDGMMKAMSLDIVELFDELVDEFGDDLLMRASVWMTLRESKASFHIEGEAEQKGRVQRFADVMARRTGRGEIPLNQTELSSLQRDILGERTTLKHFGLRQSPVFVGELIRYQEILHYVAPPADAIVSMLEGIRVFIERTEGQSSVMRSAVVAFGFVYIHPLADGNGRVHRFLVNDILRRDGVVPDPVILPISAVITDDVGERRAYDNVLDSVSNPLMHSMRDLVALSPTQTHYPDGVVSNLVIEDVSMALPQWRYPDLGPHVLFLSQIIFRTLTEQMRQESHYLRSHARARMAVKEVVEMPDLQVDRVLRTLEQNKGVLSNALAKQIPILREPGIWDEIVTAVSEVMKEEAIFDRNIIERYKPERAVRK